jgi:hypothetical protein
MNRDEILQRVTDSLCGELDREAGAELEAALGADPALAAEAARLERTWQRLGMVLDEKRVEKAILVSVFARIINQDIAELTDEELDKAAGGISMLDGSERDGGGGHGGEHK